MTRKHLNSIAPSTRLIALCFCIAALVPAAASAKFQCTSGTHPRCVWHVATQATGSYYDPNTGQWYVKTCRCVADGDGSGSAGDGSYGHAEIHKRNVPTVKPSGGVNPMSVAPTFRIAPRAPAGAVRPIAPLAR